MCSTTAKDSDSARGCKAQAAYEGLESFLGEEFHEERERVRQKGIALHDALSKYDDTQTPLDKRFAEGTVADAIRNRGPEGEMGREYSVPVPIFSAVRALGGASDKEFVDALRRGEEVFYLDRERWSRGGYKTPIVDDRLP